MTAPLSIRPYRPGDEDRVWDLHVAAARRVDAFVNPEGIEGGATTDRERHAAESRTLAADGIFLVGTVGGQAGAGAGERERAEESGGTGPNGSGDGDEARIVAMGAVDPTATADSDAVRDADVAELTRMRVDPDYWRRGYGGRMLDALESRALDRGWTTMVLETLARQEGALALYEADGYAEVDRTVVGDYDVRRYRKRLEP